MIFVTYSFLYAIALGGKGRKGESGFVGMEEWGYNETIVFV